MSDPLSTDAVPAARLTVLRWVFAALVLLVLLPRLWRFEAVGEGTDEGYSVGATRAILAGRFSYSDLNDFSSDAYQAKFCPVAEAVAAPFVAVLGDSATAFRLPSLLASLALAFFLARAAHRRFGVGASAVALALYALDYRSVVYAQTHRYVALEQLLAFGLAAAVLRASRTGRRRDALLAFGAGLLLFHTHLLAVLVIGPIFLSVVLDPRRRGRILRPTAAAVALALLLVHAVVVLWLFRSIAIGRFFDAGTIAEGLTRAAASTARTLAGLGSATAVLGIVGALGLLLSRDARDRTWCFAALGPVALYALASVRYQLAPRYALTAQPFLILCGAGLAARMLESTAGRARALVASGLALVAIPTIATTGWYLATGGGRDAEAPVLSAIVSRAARGDGVLYDISQMDPFARRPREFVPITRNVTLDPAGEARLDQAGVRWIVRSTLEPTGPLYTPSVLARLESIESWEPPALLQAPWTITLFHLKPR